MKKNNFELFLNKIFDVPLWVKQAMSLRLSQEIQDLKEEPNDIFPVFVPTLTFQGKTELLEKKCGFDNNIYNFLQCCAEGLNILEISVNNYLSPEETAKYLEFCIDQNFIKTPESKSVAAMSGFIAGKYRTGEYFEKCGIITSEQLQQIINENDSSKLFGQILIDKGYVDKNKINILFTLKAEAQKRFVLDYNLVPKSESTYSDENKKYIEEISALKEENKKLKQKMVQIHKLVRKNA